MSGFSTACLGGYEDIDRGFAYATTDWILVGIMLVVVTLRVYSMSLLIRSFGSDDPSIISLPCSSSQAL